MAVFCMVTMVTMVTENIFLIISFEHNSARLADHFGVLHDHISASIGAWDPQNPQKRLNSSKIAVLWLPWLRKYFFIIFFC